MRVLEGDIIKIAKDPRVGVLVHGCNCFCTMGAGLAKQIKLAFPQAYEQDLKTKKGSRDKLGKYSGVVYNDLIVINAYTQYNYGNGVQVDYDAIRKVFKKLKKDFGDKTIIYPRIGAGLGGGNWDIISTIIDCELEGCDHYLVNLI